MAFMVATFVVFVVNERAMKAKHSQFMTGVGAVNFWMSSFIWDALCYLIPSILIIVVVVAFQTSGYSSKDVIG
jgi:ATP-binding cassette subfamily A (ABC1) protein 3